MAFQLSEKVRLPIGLRIDGEIYRDVTLDMMLGVDEENVSAKGIKNNGAKAITVMLRRCIQKIDGLDLKKKRATDLIPARFVRNMFVADRDFLFTVIQVLSGQATFDVVVTCPVCNAKQDETIDLNKLDVLEWPDGEDPEVEIELPRGFAGVDGAYHPIVTWRFPDGVLQEELASLPENKITTASIASCVVAVEGLEHRPDTEDARRLSMTDRTALLQGVSEFTPGFNLQHDAICNECDHEWSAGVDLAGFFSSVAAVTKATTPSGRKRPKLLKQGSAKR